MTLEQKATWLRKYGGEEKLIGSLIWKGKERGMHERSTKFMHQIQCRVKLKILREHQNIFFLKKKHIG